MKLIQDDKDYAEAVPLLAVHSAISLADAILVGLTGERGSDRNHRETVGALQQLCASKRKTRDGLTHLSWLLENKTELIYGDTRLDPDTQIKSATLHAERFVAWAYKTFPEIARTGVLE
ncbi:MAG: hypothetical protein ACLPZJ_12770 [Terriglobales bacterium]